MINKLRHILLGPPLATQRLGEECLNKTRALAAFSPDALSSIAYANQEIYLALAVAGTAGLALSLPIGLAITGILVLLALSYSQTIQSYPSGGGSYIVARENLGTTPGLVAAAALLIDYTLTAAVSLTAGVAAISSAFPSLLPYRVPLALALLLLITLANLRGLRESGTLMAVPVYLFLLSYLGMLIYGGVRWGLGASGSMAVGGAVPLQPLTLLLVLRAFSSGCTALTGIEAISNGVPAFRPPQPKNAVRTMLVMTVLMAALFLGSIGLTQGLSVVPGPQETILSALARSVLGNGPLYLLVQSSVLLVLAVAANTSFADFPRVAAILAQDGFLPHQLMGLGDRLVYAKGIVLLSLSAALLIVIYSGDSHALVPLFAVGAFLAFTLSQVGMVVHWWRDRGSNWQVKAALNGLGGVATGVTLLVVGISKFTHGAWITVLLIPLLVAGFLYIRSHYRDVADQLSLAGVQPPVGGKASPRVIIPLSGVHQGVLEAVNFARSISRDVTAVYVEIEPGVGVGIVKKWGRLWPDIPLVVISSPYRSILEPLKRFVEEADQSNPDGQKATLVLPEFVPARWWETGLHNQTARLIRRAFLYERGSRTKDRVVIEIPYHLEK